MNKIKSHSMKTSNIILVFIVFLFFFQFNVFGQGFEKKKLELEKLTQRSDSLFSSQMARVKDYASKYNLPVSYYDNLGNHVEMVDVSETGVPIYMSTDNSGAAITTGVVKLRQGGGLGLSLEGDKMLVGVWDGGIVKDHVEFKDRLLSKQGTAEDNHATHVTGTIIAAGVNESAKGMAPKANATTFDFNNDLSEMLLLARPDQTSLLFSNHSYGVISGWRFNGSWSWFGDAGISNQEDYKFGYYSNSAKSFDQVAFNAPYYTICKSAGNDRSDTGTGSPPADCNGGTGYDCISDVSTAKNIITVGAVNKVFEYKDANSVAMSSFSGWGPTDDGRIKPDFVAAGVNLFSTSAAGNDQYTQLSGTSMATPNTTGSLVLLQELYKDLHAGNFMKASTLKALAIHTTKEAGGNPGPDYAFGWGLLDVEAAAKILLAEDGQNVYVSEKTLQNGKTYEVSLTPKAREKIRVTLVWTDVPGTPAPVSLDPTSIMLVNDLDIRIVDDAGNEQMPWILDPANPPAPATRGDNIRDNVEKIEFELPDPRNYRLIVKHKGVLNGGQQDFSLIVDYKSVQDPRKKLYWVGNSGNWGDPQHWSLASGGQPSGLTPTADDRVIFDENSLSENGKVELTENRACFSLTWFEKNIGSILLNGKELSIGENLISVSEKLKVENGSLKFVSSDSKSNQINVSNGDFSTCRFVINGDQSLWKVSGVLNLEELKVVSGSIDMSDITASIKGIESISSLPKSLNFTNLNLKDLKQWNVKASSNQLVSNGAVFTLAQGFMDDPSIVNSDGLNLSAKVKSVGFVSFFGESIYDDVELKGFISISGNNEFKNFNLSAGSELVLATGTIQKMSSASLFSSAQGSPISIKSIGSAGLNFEGHYKLCFDFLKITNVDLSGSAVVNAGIGSTLANSAGWGKTSCEDILFPDFEVKFNCQSSLTQFLDKSSGKIDSWEWSFGDGDAKSSVRNPYYVYPSSTKFTATLKLKKGDFGKDFKREIEIRPNDINPNEITLDNGNFFSFQVSKTYQWYRNGEAIAGANQRTYKWDGTDGAYFTTVFSEFCNRPSNIFTVTGLEQHNLTDFSIYPNPSKGAVSISIPKLNCSAKLTIYNDTGAVMYDRWINSDEEAEVVIKSMPDGLYIATISCDNSYSSKKFLIIN